MLIKSRNWDDLYRKENEINSSKETIRYFERANDSSLKKNIESSKKVEYLENLRDQLIYDFEDKFKISFDEARELVESSNNASRFYNMDEYNEIIAIIDQISGEKFYIYQRNRLINKNKEVIRDINKWIDKAESER
ncbi:hypothetical protein [Malacoplasma muris]|uniref:hypothetical protein n=1 Tax=Malacoplasma muris TaxID=2119 RepID=UPI00398F5040